MTLATFSAAIATLLGIMSALPQAVRVWRSGSAEGVAISMWLLMLFVMAVWIGLGVREESAVIVVANAAALPAAAAVVMGILRANGWPRLFTAAYLLACMIAILVGLWIGVVGAISLVTVIMILGSCARLPQVWESWRTWRFGRPSQVASSYWWLTLSANAIWVIIGTTASSIPIIAASVLGLAIVVLVLLLEQLARLNRATRACDDS